MKMFMPILCLASLILAEPPFGDGYPASRSSHDHESSDHQRSLSDEYGPPSDIQSSRNAPSTGHEYNPPNSRSSLNARGQPQKHVPPTVRVSFNQRFSSLASRSSPQSQAPSANVRSGTTQENGPPAAKSLSQEYGVPSPVSARTVSTEYGLPNARSAPSKEYGVPSFETARSNQKSHSAASNFRNGFSQDRSAPTTRSQFQTESFSHAFTASSARSNNAVPKPFAKSPVQSSRNAHSRSQSSSHGSSSNTNGNFQNVDTVSQTYGVPSQRDLSETYKSNTRGLSQEYGVPSSRTNLMTDAISSSFTSASSRSSPSSTYLPAARNGVPSEQYGVPEQRNAGSQGYDNARARALEELQNQEPASYDFGYQIEDQESGSDFGHTETREANSAHGSYFVMLPDGTKQTVEYEADERGYKPRISVEPAAGGYDENAAELARSAEGPY